MKKEPRYFTVSEFNRITANMAYALLKFRKERRLLSKALEKQIMLAVSEVNSCRICSYVHTQALLKEGASEEELASLLSGTITSLNKEHHTAILFAEHYADTTGNYDQDTFAALVRDYGYEKAVGIVATIEIIMFGNANGIAFTNLANRLRFRRNKNSKLLTELYTGPFAYLFLPFCLIITVFRKKKVIS